VAAGDLEIRQENWSGGICQAVERRHVPPDAAWDIRDGLLDDDGAVYQRGAIGTYFNPALGTRIDGVWDAEFFMGRRTVVASDAGFGVINGGSWFSLSTWTGVAGGGLAAKTGDVLLVPVLRGGSGEIIAYAGAVGLDNVATGSFTVTKGSDAVTAGSADFVAGGVVPGHFLMQPSGDFVGVVKSRTRGRRRRSRPSWMCGRRPPSTFRAGRR
jgi:hypothetical protein